MMLVNADLEFKVSAARLHTLVQTGAFDDAIRRKRVSLRQNITEEQQTPVLHYSDWLSELYQFGILSNVSRHPICFPSF